MIGQRAKACDCAGLRRAADEPAPALGAEQHGRDQRARPGRRDLRVPVGLQPFECRFTKVLALLQLAFEVVFLGGQFRLFLEVEKDLLEVHGVSHFLFEMGRVLAM